MQKSKIFTVCVAVLILIYSIISALYLNKLQYINSYIINPLIWIFFAIMIRLILGNVYENKKLRKEIFQYALIAVLALIIVYLLSGLIVTFGKNPYSATLKGFLTNMWILGTPIIAKEYIRFKLVNNVYNDDRKLIAIIVTTVFTIIDFQIVNILNFRLDAYYIFKNVIGLLIPIIAKNILYTYMSMNGGYLGAISYELLTNVFLWISPILPNSPWIVTAIVDSIIPIILFMYIRHTINKNSIFKSKESIQNSDPRNIIPLVIIVVLAIWFSTGVFPIKPVAIATASMHPQIKVGDVAIIKKCNANSIKVDDVIEYQMEGYTVVHRVIEIKQEDGEFFFETKGDNNQSKDGKPVREDQLIGKCIFKVKYLGYPAIWLHLSQVKEEQVEVETGK